MTDQDAKDRALSDILTELDSVRGQLKHLRQIMVAGDSGEVAALASGLQQRLQAVLEELERFSEKIEQKHDEP
jgi:hypothetical protein